MQENVFEPLLPLSHLFTTDEGLGNNHSNNDKLHVLKDHKILNEDTKLYFLCLTSNNESAPINVIHSNLIKPLSLLRGNCWSTELTMAITTSKAINKGSKSDHTILEDKWKKQKSLKNNICQNMRTDLQKC